MRIGTSPSRASGSTASPDVEPVAEARALDLDVAIEQLELARERHAIDRAGIERFPEELTEAADHPLGRGGILVNELRDGVQGVEEEVRMELHPQQLKARLGEPCFAPVMPAARARAPHGSTPRRGPPQ